MLLAQGFSLANSIRRTFPPVGRQAAKEKNMELRDLENLIKTRRSIRKWKRDSVPEDLVLKAIEMATWAPNAGNHQNWKFFVVVNRNLIRRMADTVQSKVETIASWPEAAPFGEEVDRWKRNGSFFQNAIAVFFEIGGKLR